MFECRKEKYIKFEIAFKLYEDTNFRTPQKGTYKHFKEWFTKESEIGSMYIPKGALLQPEATHWETIKSLGLSYDRN